MPRNSKGKEKNDLRPIIKKKLYSGDGGHHGGVWKIAYADFMTAMMTFFLVMWLINSSSKEKITQLANYFNPVKLNDRTPPIKSVRDGEGGGTVEEKAPKKEEKKTEKPATKAEEVQPKSQEEESLFRNPFGVLTQLASQAEGEMAVVMSQSGSGTLASGGSSHDPFVTDPVVSQPLVRVTVMQPAAKDAPDLDPAATPQPAKSKTEPGSEDKHAKAKTPPDSGEQPVRKDTLEAAAQLAKEIARLNDSLPPSLRPAITTRATPEGVLISLTDDLNFSMFKVASAVPSPQLVVVLEKVGNLLNKHPGSILIRGHTDGRPYSGDAHGNWRLSINRANMTYFMLLRAKVDDTRFLAVEGYADRNLRNKTDPLAAENRRIEILIRGTDS
jgi:chemotaxis protein MotB